jgi:hypothetical protein
MWRYLGSLGILLWSSLALAGPGVELGNGASPKVPRDWPANFPVSRQGGDTIESAFVINSVPFTDQGTTTGFSNDYDAACPFTNSVAPDVVYRYTPATAERISIDLCGSSYDTKLYVMDADFTVLACNDDWYTGPPCGGYVSAYAGLELTGGEVYYIVVDGYGTEHGEYSLAITIDEPCIVGAHQDAQFEFEPPLVDGYVDSWNGGCNSDGQPFQELDQFPLYEEKWFYGVSGWYLYSGANYRDTDWFTVSLEPGGELDVTLVAEQTSTLYQLDATDCNNVLVLQFAQAEPCEPATLHIEGTAGSTVWLWVGPSSQTPPPDFLGHEYHYSLQRSGWQGPPDLSFVGADRAPGCPSLPLGWVEATTDFSSFQDDYHAPAGCFSNPATGPDAIFEVYMQAGENLDFENEYTIYPQPPLARTPEDSVVCYLVDDLRLGDGSCVDAFGSINHRWDTFTALETGFHYLIIDFTGGSPDHSTRMYIWNEASAPPPAPAHDTCDGAIEIPGYGPFDFADELSAARNQYDLAGASGVGGTMGDVVYRVSMAFGDRFDATMTGIGWQEAMYLVRDCTNVVGSCAAVAAPGGPDAVHLLYTATEPGDYWLICDSYGIGPRPFTLTGSLLSGLTDAGESPAQVTLHAPAPNPFNPRTTLSFWLPASQTCRLAVYSLDGRLVRTLLEESLAAGAHETVWDGTDAHGARVASGTYVCRLEAGQVTTLRRVVLVK